MNVLTPGHVYELDMLDARAEDLKHKLAFVQRVGCDGHG